MKDKDILELLGLDKNITLEYDLNYIINNGIDNYLNQQQEYDNKKKEFMELFKACFDDICLYMEKDPKRRVSVNCFTCVKGMDLRDQYGKRK